MRFIFLSNFAYNFFNRKEVSVILKVSKYLFVLVLLCVLSIPTFANAEEREIISQDIKYYKTVTHNNLFTTFGAEQENVVVT